VIVGLATAVAVARFLLFLGLKHYGQLSAWRPHQKPPLYRHLVTNPIAWREFSRSSGWLHGSGWLGAVLLAFQLPVFWWLVAYNVVRAGTAAMDLVSREREQRTLDAVLQTRVTNADFIQGVLCAAALPRMVESLLLLGVASLLANPPAMPLAVAVVLLGPIGAATIGLFSAVLYDTRKQCRWQFAGGIVGWILFGVIWAVTEFPIGLGALITLVAYPALLLANVRNALRREHPFSD
jgi:hypothetical protein